MKNMINKMTYIRSVQNFLFPEIRNFAKTFVKFRKFSPEYRPTRNTKDRKLQS